MSKHTLRPWRVEWVRWGDEQDLKVCDSHGALLTMNTRGLTGAPEMEANARLIAAAPDMKEELLNVRDSLAGALAGTMPLRETASELLDSVQDAIAKAEGRE